MVKEALDDYDKEAVKLANLSTLIRLTIHLTMEMVMERKADLKQKDFSTIDKVAVFISEPVDIQSTKSVVLDERCTDGSIVVNLRKIGFCNSQYMLFYYVLLFLTDMPG